MDFHLKKLTDSQLKLRRDRKRRKILTCEFCFFVWTVFCLAIFLKSKLEILLKKWNVKSIKKIKRFVEKDNMGIACILSTKAYFNVCNRHKMDPKVLKITMLEILLAKFVCCIWWKDKPRFFVEVKQGSYLLLTANLMCIFPKCAW